MKRVSNSLIALLMIIIMLFSVINTLFITYYIDKKLEVTGRTTLQGTVSVIVDTNSSSPVITTGGGGGGGGSSRTSVIHILDFINKDIYFLVPYKGDTYITQFINNNYTFKNKGFSGENISMSVEDFDFILPKNKLLKLDFDSDDNPEISLQYDGTYIIFTAIRLITEKIISPPKISIEDIKNEPGLRLPFRVDNNLIWLIIFLSIISLFISYVIRKSILQKNTSLQELEAIKIYKNYKSKFKKEKMLDSFKSDALAKINLQKDILEERYNKKEIPKDAYFKGKNKIYDIIKKI